MLKKIFIVTAICILTVCGCGKSITEQYEEKSADGSMDAPEYGVRQLAFDSENEVLNYNICCYKNGMLYYITGGDMDENSVFTYSIHAYDVANEKDSLVKEVSSRDIDTEKFAKSIWGISALDNGDITIYADCDIADENMHISFNIIKITYNSAGEEISRITLEQPEGIEDTNMLDSYNSRCYERKDGGVNVMVVTNSLEYYYILYDKYGKEDGMVKAESMEPGFPDEDDNMVVCETKEDGVSYGYIDYAGKRIDKEPYKELNDNKSNTDMWLMGVDGKNPYLTDGKYIYEYFVADKQLNRLVNLDMCGIGGDGVNYMCRLDEDRLMCLTNMGNGTELFILDRNLKTVEKEAVKIAGLTRDDGELITAVNEYNRGDHEYRIDFVNYEESGIEGMMKDIMTGSAPDIYLLEGMDADNLINKGLLEDLMPYMEKDDVLNKDYFIDGFLDKTGNDGKQHMLMKKFRLSALLGHGKDVGKLVDNSSANMAEELMKIYESKPESTVFINDTDIGMSAGAGLYEIIMSGCISDYLDYEAGKSSFDSEGFRQILDICRKTEESYDEDISIDSAEKLKKGKILLQNRNIYGINDLQYDNVIYGGDAAYIGYPSAGNVYMICEGSTIAMSSSSDKKDAAWSVIKELMTGSYRKREHNEFNSGIPVSKKEFDEMIKEATTTEEYSAEDGETIYPQNVVGDNVSYGPATESDVEAFRQLIDRAVYDKNNKQVVEVTADAAEQYIKGNKGLDETISVIQDKMDKYVNENR